MCPLYPFHLVLLYLCLLLPLLLAVVEASEELIINWKPKFIPDKVTKLREGNHTQVRLECDSCPIPEPEFLNDLSLALYSDNPKVCSLQQLGYGLAGPEIMLKMDTLYGNATSGWALDFNVTGEFVGMTMVKAEVRNTANGALRETKSSLPVSVVKKKSIWSKLFGYSVALLISLAYINMGCAMDLGVVRETLRRPIAPTIGFVCQYVIMPLIAFCVGFAFYDNPAMRLGLFVTGCSPGGGASNIWTLMFGGNLSLSLTMTAISTFAAFFMMPLWLFSLGTVIFSEHAIVIPYYKICTYAVCLVVPLSIGLLLQRKAPRVSAFLVRILKPVALFLILFILIFGIWANFWMFRVMTWRVWITGMALPWLGFAFGCTFARLSRRSAEDVIAIAIETGVQNTGVSIFILWFTFDHPLGDLAAVVPVAVATMTPFPLLMSLLYMKLREWAEGRKRVPGSEEEVKEESPDPEMDAVNFKQSESCQKLMPIVKDKASATAANGCIFSLSTDPNGNI